MDHHNHSHDHLGGIILKVLLVVIVGGAIFGVGVCAGIRAAVWRGVASPQTLPKSLSAAPAGMMQRAADKEWGWGDRQDHKTSRVFGVITKIEVNKITILDNAAKTEMILSLANTVITASSSEVGLGALKVGQNIVAFGALDSNNMFEAQLIQVQ